MTETSNAWYSKSGKDDDVIISTRGRLARNLADFMFPSKLSDDDSARVVSLIYDASSFNQNYSLIDVNQISTPSKRLLKEKNVLSGNKCSVVLLDGGNEDAFCLVNETDHLKIVELAPGFQPASIFKRCYEKDELFQKKLQFAGSFELGYLTSRLRDLGSGLKITLRIFIPAVVLSGKLKEITDFLSEKQCYLNAVYPAAARVADFSNFLFDLTSTNSFSGNELDQIAQIQSAGEYVLKTERKISAEFADNNPTVVLNFFRQSYAKAMNSLLLSYDEGVDIISCVKWGLSCKLITGITHAELDSMYFATKDGYLDYMCNSFSFNFEPDVKNDVPLQLKRLRAAVIQQTFEGITNEKSVS